MTFGGSSSSTHWKCKKADERTTASACSLWVKLFLAKCCLVLVWSCTVEAVVWFCWCLLFAGHCLLVFCFLSSCQWQWCDVLVLCVLPFNQTVKGKCQALVHVAHKLCPGGFVMYREGAEHELVWKGTSQHTIAPWVDSFLPACIGSGSQSAPVKPSCSCLLLSVSVCCAVFDCPLLTICLFACLYFLFLWFILCPSCGHCQCVWHWLSQRNRGHCRWRYDCFSLLFMS